MEDKRPSTKTGTTKQGKQVTWQHPGGKLLRLGPEHCTDAELLAILIGSGCVGKTAEEIATDIINKYHSLYGLMGKSLKDIMEIKGLKQVKAVKLSASFEIARRIVKSLEKE